MNSPAWNVNLYLSKSLTSSALKKIMKLASQLEIKLVENGCQDKNNISCSFDRFYQYYDNRPFNSAIRRIMAIQINKPITGGTGSVTTGERSGGSSLNQASQASAIEDVLDALKTANIISNFIKDDTLADTSVMSNRTRFTVIAARKEACDHAIDVVNMLDNVKVMP